MKLIFIDTCLFIDLCNLHLINELFQLEQEIHISYEIFNDIDNINKNLICSNKSFDRLNIHKMGNDSYKDMYEMNYPNYLGHNDKTGLFVANKVSGLVITTDSVVCSYLKSIGIEFQGILWIFDMFVSNGILIKSDAIKKMNNLIETNKIYQPNLDLTAEAKKRIKLWL